MNDIDLTEKKLREEEGNSESKANVDAKIRKLLSRVGISSYTVGFGMWTIAIKLYKEKPNISLTKGIYPKIAEEFFKMTPARVEIILRSAVREAFIKCPDDVFESIFGDIIYQRNNQPTNWEFLTMLAERI